jgi:hypothetical protein
MEVGPDEGHPMQPTRREILICEDCRKDLMNRNFISLNKRHRASRTVTITEGRVENE